MAACLIFRWLHIISKVSITWPYIILHNYNIYLYNYSYIYIYIYTLQEVACFTMQLDLHLYIYSKLMLRSALNCSNFFIQPPSHSLMKVAVCIYIYSHRNVRITVKCGLVRITKDNDIHWCFIYHAW